MKISKPTFDEILEQAKQKNSERLMAKTRLANWIAKRSHGVNRRNACDIKSIALCSLIKKLSLRVRVFKDIKETDFVVVELKTPKSELHLLFAKLVDWM